MLVSTSRLGQVIILPSKVEKLRCDNHWHLPWAIPQGSIFPQSAGRVYFLNEAFSRFIGHRAAMLKGKPLIRQLSATDRNATELLLKQALLEKILTLELQVLDLTDNPRN